MMTPVCPKAKLVKMHIYARAHSRTHPNALSHAKHIFIGTRTCAQTSAQFALCYKSLFFFVLYFFTLCAFILRSHTYSFLLQHSSKARNLRASEAEVASVIECKSPLPHSHAWTHTAPSARSPLLPLPPTVLNGRGRREEKGDVKGKQVWKDRQRKQVIRR